MVVSERATNKLPAARREDERKLNNFTSEAINYLEFEGGRAWPPAKIHSDLNPLQLRKI